MKKYFVLDTNVLLHDPLAMFQFADNVVIIPIIVLEEIDLVLEEIVEEVEMGLVKKIKNLKKNFLLLIV